MIPSSMVKDILEEMYELRNEMVPCFIGDPGIGKTQGIYEFAEEKGVNVVTFILSNTVPSEVSGIRMPDTESKTLQVFDDIRMASLQDGDILFFDEVLEAPPALWSACLTLIQDRIMASGKKLPNVFIVAASNKVATPAIIPASTRDRFMFIELSFDFVNWCNWFERTRGVQPSTRLLPKIKGESDQYNILTPRRFTKLYDWLKLGITDTKYNVITDMFDLTVWKELTNTIQAGNSIQHQICDALINAGILTETYREDYENMDYNELLETLMHYDRWDKIKAVLESSEFVDVTVNNF